jgi:hypothetical protein
MLSMRGTLGAPRFVSAPVSAATTTFSLSTSHATCEQPEQREQPEQPEQREQPEQPEQSEQSEQSEQPEQSEQREQREQPEQPEQSEQPEQPEQREQPEQPEQPEQFVQFWQFVSVSSEALAACSEPKYSMLARLPAALVIEPSAALSSCVFPMFVPFPVFRFWLIASE